MTTSSPAAMTTRPSGLDIPVGSACMRSMSWSLSSARKLEPMRHTVFRRRMIEEFGEIRAETLAQDHVCSALGGRTVDQALEAGMHPKQVWQAICEVFEVPAERR